MLKSTDQLHPPFLAVCFSLVLNDHAAHVRLSWLQGLFCHLPQVSAASCQHQYVMLTWWGSWSRKCVWQTKICRKKAIYNAGCIPLMHHVPDRPQDQFNWMRKWLIISSFPNIIENKPTPGMHNSLKHPSVKGLNILSLAVATLTMTVKMVAIAVMCVLYSRS